MFFLPLFTSSPGRAAATLVAGLVILVGSRSTTEAASFLFDASHAETASNADWVIDEDSSAQRFPTPDQSTVTAATPETYWRGAISAWGIELVKRGHHVETLPSGTALTYGNSSNPQDLSNYQVFVVDEPNSLFKASEKTAILNFVKNGGSLFMISDHADSDRNGDGKDSVQIWNDLFSNNTVQAAPFGITFNSVDVSPSHESCDTSATDPITHGVYSPITEFVFSNGATLTLDTTKNASVKGAVWTTSSHTNSNVMVAYGTFGAGKFVAIGDSSPEDDGTGNSSDTLFNGWSGDSVDDGHLVINASLWLATPLVMPPPPNDNFASATLISGSTVSITGTNVNATKEVNEPNHGGDGGGHSVWWSWMAPSSGTVVLDTNGSNFDTTLGVYTGGAVGALTAVASDNNGGPNLTSKVTFAATAGVVYKIAVDGTGSATGNITLNLVLTAPPTAGTIATLASWNFDSPITVNNASTYPNPIPADSGNGSINLSGWTGTISAFGGSPGTGSALSPNTGSGAAAATGNGSYLAFNFSMTGYRSLTISFDTRGTSTGYTSGTWSWSVDGVNFTTVPAVNTASTSASFEAKAVDFSAFTALNNAASVQLRYTLNGASGGQQNNRIDNFLISATLTPAVTVVVNKPDAFEKSTQTGMLTVSSSLAAGAGGLPITFALSGTAAVPGLSNSDYSLSGNSSSTTVTIPAGATSATVTLSPVADTDPTEFDETAVLALQSGANYFLGNPAAGTVTIHDDTPYTSAWAQQFPNFHGAIAAPTLDIEGDGASNLLEFAFNGDPFHSDRSILPVTGTMNFTDPTDNMVKPYPTISFVRRTDAPNLDYFVETSTDLTAWNNQVEEVSATPLTATTEQVVYRGLSPLSGTGAVTPVFLHVRVVLEQ